MLIVEGPDGSGKSTLCRELSLALDWPVADRVVDKDTNALQDLTAWTEANVNKGFQGTIFDRHRLVSEPIYGPIMRRGPVDQRGLYKLDWMEDMMIRFMHCDPIIIFCLPPFEAVVKNLDNDPDNLAVSGKIDAVYRSYVSAVPLWSRTGVLTFVYDYTDVGFAQDSWLNRSIKTYARSRLMRSRSSNR